MSKLNLVQVLKTGAVAAAFAMSGLAAQAAQGHGGHRGGPGEMMLTERALDAVDATDAQRSQIKAIMQAARAELKGTHEAGRKLHAQGLALFSATNVDAAAIEALRVQGQALREQASKRMTQALVDAARVLTPEQRAKLADKLAKRHARMAEHKKERSAATPRHGS